MPARHPAAACTLGMDRAKRFGLAALMAFLALNIWTGSPLLALWIGSQVQGERQPGLDVGVRRGDRLPGRSSASRSTRRSST